MYKHLFAKLANQIDTSDFPIVIGGSLGGIVSFFNHISIFRIIDFSAHALLGAIISYSVKYGIDRLFIRKRKKNEPNS